MFKNKRTIALFVAINFIVIVVLSVSFSIFFSSKTYMIKKNYNKIAIEYIHTNEKTENTYLCINIGVEPIAFVDFEKEKFKLIEGKLPLGEKEVIVSDIYAVYKENKVGDVIDHCTTYLNRDYKLKIVGIFETGLSKKQKNDLADYSLMEIGSYFATRFTSIANYPAFEKEIKGVSCKFNAKFDRNFISNSWLTKVDKELLKKEHLLIGDEIKEENELIISAKRLAELSNTSIEELMRKPTYYFETFNKNLLLNKNYYNVEDIYRVVGVHKTAEFDFATYDTNNIAHLAHNSSYIANIDNITSKTKLRRPFIASDPLENTIRDLKILRKTFGVIMPIVLLGYVLYIFLIIIKMKKSNNYLSKNNFYMTMLKYFGISMLAFILIGLPILLIFQLPDLAFSVLYRYFYVLRVFAVLLGIALMAGIMYLISYLLLFRKQKKSDNLSV